MEGSQIWLKRGILIGYGEMADNAMHQHHLIQVVWDTVGTICQCEINTEVLAGSCIIDSQVEHRLHACHGWVLLVEPKSNLGRSLKALLDNKEALSISNRVEPYVVSDNPITNPVLELKSLFSDLSLLQHMNLPPIQVVDKRIQQLLDRLDMCLQGNCLKPHNWSAKEAAQSISLSESRFRHLFSQQMAISWRPYLRWRRLSAAVFYIMADMSVTEAAHATGFSDSSHLSRTFRTMFGLTIQQAKKIYKER